MFGFVVFNCKLSACAPNIALMYPLPRKRFVCVWAVRLRNVEISGFALKFCLCFWLNKSYRRFLMENFATLKLAPKSILFFFLIHAHACAFKLPVNVGLFSGISNIFLSCGLRRSSMSIKCSCVRAFGAMKSHNS